MSYLDYVMGRLKRGIITFVNMVTLAHRDFPYHDYEEGSTAVAHKHYVVGNNNLAGSQKKRFVSKSTLIHCDQDSHVHFNHSGNVEIPIVANTWYTFMSNIHAIWYGRDVGEATGTMKITVEGVLPQEARTPE